MAGLKELRTRISSITSTRKITSAMKMVAAARLKRSTDMLNKSKAYSQDLETIIGRLIKTIRREEAEKNVVYPMPKVMLSPTKEENYLLVIFSSDKGLCGSYNTNILKESLQRINELVALGKRVKVLSLGKKAGEALRRRCNGVEIEIWEGFAAKGPDYNENSKLVERLLSGLGVNFDICEVVYTHFHSAVNREIKVKQFLPVALDIDTQDERYSPMSGNAFYSYEGGKLALLQNIMPLFVTGTMFFSLVNSQTSEHGARMTAMDNATRNAKDIIDKLTLKYNRLRQSAITTELIEIISGAEAL